MACRFVELNSEDYELFLGNTGPGSTRYERFFGKLIPIVRSAGWMLGSNQWAPRMPIR